MEILFFEILDIQKKDEIIHLLKTLELDVFESEFTRDVWIVIMLEINIISILGFTNKLENVDFTDRTKESNFKKVFIDSKMLKLISAETF